METHPEVKEPEVKRAAGILLLSAGTGRFLLNRRSEKVSKGGTLAPFGGMVEPREHPEDAARREMLEETSREAPSTLRLVHVLLHPGFRYLTYCGTVKEEFVPELNWESDGYEWAEPADLMVCRELHPGFARMVAECADLMGDLHDACANGQDPAVMLARTEPVVT